MPQVQASIFMRFLHIWMNTFSLSCTGNCQHEVEHKTVLAPDDFMSLAGSWYFILVLSWYCFSVGKRLSFPSSSSSSLLCCFRWCGHLKSEFLIQQECSRSCDSLESLTSDFGLLNYWFIFTMKRSQILWNLQLGKDYLQFIARQTTLQDKEYRQGCCYQCFPYKLKWGVLVGWFSCQITFENY